MTDRRGFLVLGLGAGALAACGPGGPGAVTVNATGAAGMNPGADGADRPVTVNVLQLRSTAAFDAADILSLQNPSAALGGDLIAVTPIALAPGATASQIIGLDPGVTALGFVAGFLSPGGKQTRTVVPIGPTDTKTATVTVDGAGLAVSI